MDLRKFEQREQKEESTIEKEIEVCQNTKISHIPYFKKKHPLAFDVDKGINYGMQGIIIYLKIYHLWIIITGIISFHMTIV
jgi:hypothetical protein